VNLKHYMMYLLHDPSQMTQHWLRNKVKLYTQHKTTITTGINFTLHVVGDTDSHPSQCMTDTHRPLLMTATYRRTVGDFTFWLSLRLSLLTEPKTMATAQSKLLAQPGVSWLRPNLIW